MQRRTAEAMQLINQSKQARLQEQLAQTMESFQIGDDASTFDEMRDKIDRRAAAAEAKLQLGSAQSTTRCRTSSVKRWICNCRTSCWLTNRRWDCLPAGERTRCRRRAKPAGASENDKNWTSHQLIRPMCRPQMFCIFSFSRCGVPAVGSFMAEFPKFDLKYLKEAFKEPLNFWGLATFGIGAAYFRM